jgi:hypothetical protein
VHHCDFRARRGVRAHTPAIIDLRLDLRLFMRVRDRRLAQHARRGFGRCCGAAVIDSKRQHGSAMLVARQPVRARAWLDDLARPAYGPARS